MPMLTTLTRPSSRRFFLIFILVVFLLGLGHGYFNHWLSWDRSSLLQFQFWRLLSGHLVHNNIQHMLMNLSVFAFASYLYGDCFRLRIWCVFFLVLCLVNSVALFIFNPQLENYVGMSGVMYGILVLGLVKSFRAGPIMNALILLFISGKIIWEQLPGFDANYMREQIATAVIVDAHLYGYLTGWFLLGIDAVTQKVRSEANPVSKGNQLEP